MVYTQQRGVCGNGLREKVPVRLGHTPRTAADSEPGAISLTETRYDLRIAEAVGLPPDEEAGGRLEAFPGLADWLDQLPERVELALRRAAEIALLEGPGINSAVGDHAYHAGIEAGIEALEERPAGARGK